MLNKPNTLLYALLSGVLLTLSWYFGLAPLIFIAFVPLLIIEDHYALIEAKRKRLKLFGLSYLTFVIWNIGVTWWMSLVEFGQVGAILAWFANALLMAWVFLIFSNIKNRINKPWTIWLLVPIWVMWEYLHSVWDLAWIWLDLSNVFAFQHQWVQWFEFTGMSGGTVWVLAVNVLVFQLFKGKKDLRTVLKPLAVIIIPIILSFIILAIEQPLSENGTKNNMVIVQPNIDPYNEKFDTDFSIQFLETLKQLQGNINSETDYLVLPETFITTDINEAVITESEPMIWIRDSILRKFPKLRIVVGASTYCFYGKNALTATARKNHEGDYYDMFNTALQIDSNGVQIYHKSKLVPMVERMPFPGFFKLFEGLAIEMGGTSGSLGTQNERTNFYDANKTGISPVVCYESVFSEYVAEYIRNGSDYIFIITNDGWWQNSPGHIQHLNYARLRAIETRRQIARSANTGVSCFIDEFGNISQPTKYWEEAVISAPLWANKNLTFFVRFGDMISKICTALGLSALLYYWFFRFFKR